jgi:hypothetical protein
MSGARNSTLISGIAALILFSPVLGLLVMIAAEMVIDLLREAGAAADCTTAAGAIGWVLLRQVRLAGSHISVEVGGSLT